MPRLLSVNVGLPRYVTWNGKTVRTSVWKSPVDGRRMVRKLDIDGDAQADLAGHGGEHRAVCVYQMDSYHYWERFLGRSDFTFGQFGENFTVEGLPDNEVCIGDRYRIGSAEFEVTQPRVTCYRVGIRMNEPRMPALLVAHHRPGFYFRVLQEGEVGAGDDIAKITDGPERISVADVDALLYLPGHSSEQLQRALQIPALSKGWQSSFQAMLQAEKSQQEIWWIYGARNRVEHPFAEESRSLLKQLSRGRGYIVYSRPAASDKVGTDFDAPGRIDTALLERIGVTRNSDFYLCGPPSFLQNMRDGLRNWGVLTGNVHTEIFGSLEGITPGIAQVVHTPHLPQGPAGSGAPVSFARSGITSAWDPKFASLLELAEACDVPVRWSCRSGVCHTCMTGFDWRIDYLQS
jgi:MOSC domain-containing protein YiiM